MVIRNNVLIGPDLHIPVPDVNLGQQLYEELVKRNREDVAFKDIATGRYNSVGKVLDDSFKLAQSLVDFGVSSTSVMALSANNHINYPTVVLAALYAGVPLALMNPGYTEYEFEKLLNIVEPEIVFCSEMNFEILVRAKSKCTAIKKLIIIDETQPYGRGDLDFEKCLIAHNTDFKIKKINPKEHIAFIMFSSGTTGLPKGVAMTHHSMNSTLIALDHPLLAFPLKADVGLGVLPFFHIHGFYQLISVLQKSVPLMTMEHFSPFDYLKCIQDYKFTTLVGVPPLLNLLAKSPIIEDYDLSCLKEVCCGSAPIGEDILLLVKSRFNLHTVRNMYGSTEAHMMISVTYPDSKNLRSVGKVCPGISLCIKDLRTGENLPANRQGEICTKSEMMMKGYYKNESATKASFTEDGWLKSGDIGYYDNEGYLYVVDRLKEFIKYKGFQVPPAELEAVLMTNPKVTDVGVIGKPDPVAGELPVAFIVKDEGVDLNEDEVKSFIAKFLSKQKHLHEVYFVDEIPRTRSGKIVRRELKKLLEKITKSKL